jgi:hypothetical protein
MLASGRRWISSPVQLDTGACRPVHRTGMARHLHTARCIQASSFAGFHLHKTHLYASKSRSSGADYVCAGDLSIFNKKRMDRLIDHLLFEDESMIRDDQAIQRTWFLKGK